MGTTLRKLAALTAAGLTLAGTAASAHPNQGDWATWQGDKAGSRHNPSEYRINPANAGKLELKWAFAYEKTGVVAKSQPAVAGGDIFFGGPDMKFYALDAKSGRTKWTF